MNSDPRVSVLIPTFNYARFLPETLNSVLCQDLRDIEVVVVDDASTDETPSVMQTLATRDPRITFIRHERNLGMVENWNWCLGRARGAYVKYLFADDRLSRPDSLRRMAEMLDAHPQAVLATCAREIMDEHSQRTNVVRPLGRRARIFSGDSIRARCTDRDAKFINPVGEPSAVMFRRSVAARGFDPAFRQLVDIEMWLHLLAHGDLVYLPEPLCSFRRHAGQQTQANRMRYLHQQEELDLCIRYTRPSALNRVLFRKCYRIGKLDIPELAPRLKETRARFTPLEAAWHYTVYKLTRPFENALHSVAKRFGTDNQDGEA